MTCSLVAGLTLDLLLSVDRKVAKEIPDISQWTIADINDDIAEFHLNYAIPDSPEMFCILHVSASQYEPPELFFEVYVDYTDQCMDEEGVLKIPSEPSAEFANVKTVTATGTVNYIDIGEVEKTILSRSVTKPRFKVRYKVTRDVYDTSRDYHNRYDFDEVADIIASNIKLLYHLFRTSNRENLKKDNL